MLAEVGADLVAVQEADRRIGRRVGLLDLDAIARRAGLRLLQVSELLDGHGWHGNALLVRSGTTLRRPIQRLHLPGVEPRGAIVVELDTASGPLRIVATHLGLLPGCRVRQANAILSTLGTSGWDVPTLMMGDLNEWRSGVSALAAFASVFGRPHGAPSFPARRPMLSLDRIMGHPHGIVGMVEVHDTPLARKASDHLPIKAQIHGNPISSPS